MSMNIRYPNITPGSEKEQIAQIKSYLHQLVDQLNYALPSAGAGEGASQAPTTFEVQGGEMSYYDLRTLIVQEVQEVQALFDKLSAKMLSEYVSDAEVPQIVNEALAQAKESGEFDGYTPVKGVDYFDGEDGEDGYTPQKGVDYFDGEDGYTPQKGIDYFDGEDGISPSVDVNPFEEEDENGVVRTGHTISITEEAGSVSFNVFNGIDGYTPQKGVDYYTDEEIDEVATEAAGRISFTLDDDGNLYYELEE